MPNNPSPHIAIIGAGLTGLILARELATTGQVTLFEKSRGLGGRLATRYAEPYQFDHGAQSFRAITPDFQAFLRPLAQAGVIAPWQARVVTLNGQGEIQATDQPDQVHYVGVPKMNQIGKYLAAGLSIQRQIRITHIQGQPQNWWLHDAQGQHYGPYTWVISTAPPAQTVALLPAGYLPAVQPARMLGCYVLMLGLAAPLALDWQAAVVEQSSIRWLALNHTKPGRPSGYSIVALSSAAWAEARLEDEPASVQQALLQATSDIVQQDLTGAAHSGLHRWRYAENGQTVAPGIDHQAGLIACGDWCQPQGGVEGAYYAAQSVIQALRVPQN